MRGWGRDEQELLPPGYRLDTIDAAVWALRRPDGTAVRYFGVREANRKEIERAAREDYRRRSRKSGRQAIRM